MVKNIVILCIIVGGIYLFLKKFTMYRCPKCRSRHIIRLKNDERYAKDDIVYMCQECSAIVHKQK